MNALIVSVIVPADEEMNRLKSSCISSLASQNYSIIESDSRWFLKCSCGEKDCRKTVRSIDFLPYKLFNKYVPFIPSAFKKKYERDHKSKK